MGECMSITTKLLGFASAVLSILLWVVTLGTDPAPGAITAAGTLTIMVAIAGVLTAVNL